MDGANRHFPFHCGLVAVHHVIGNPEHIPQVVVFRIRNSVADGQFGMVPAAFFFPLAGVLHPLDVPDHSLFVCLPVDRQELVAAHPVDMLCLAQVCHQQRRDLSDIGVAFPLSVQTIDGTQIVDVNKNKRKCNCPVPQELCFVFLDIQFIAGTGAQSAERVHHDLLFQYGCRILQ